MAGKEAFTSEEWRTLQFAPYWAFQLVSHADGTIEDEESGKLVDILFDKPETPSELAKEVLKSITDDLDGVAKKYSGDERKPLDGFAEVASILEGKVSAEEAKDFKDALMDVSRKIAQAEGVFEEGEKDAIAKIATALRLYV